MDLSFKNRVVSTKKINPTTSEMVIETDKKKYTVDVDEATNSIKVVKADDIDKKADAAADSQTTNSADAKKEEQKVAEESAFLKDAQQKILSSLDKSSNPADAEGSISQAYFILSQDKINELKQFLFDAALMSGRTSSEGYNTYLQVAGLTDKTDKKEKNPFNSFDSANA